MNDAMTDATKPDATKPDATKPDATPGEAMQSDPTPIFTKMIDLVAWLTNVSRHFPRLHRATITRRLLDAALDCQERLLEANSVRGAERLASLHAADACLDRLRHYLRLVHTLKWLSLGQYEHASAKVAEIGRLLGGWQKTTRRTVDSSR